MITLKVERYFINDDGEEMAVCPSFGTKNADILKTLAAALRQTMDFPTLLPPELGTWREMTDEEAQEYLAMRAREERRQHIIEQGDDDD